MEVPGLLQPEPMSPEPAEEAVGRNGLLATEMTVTRAIVQQLLSNIQEDRAKLNSLWGPVQPNAMFNSPRPNRNIFPGGLLQGLPQSPDPKPMLSPESLYDALQDPHGLLLNYHGVNSLSHPIEQLRDIERYHPPGI